MKSRARTVLTSCVVAMVLAIASTAAAEDDRLGGHFGAVFPLVSHAGGSTTTINDDFKVGFPMGITIKKARTWAFDLEVVPVITSHRFVSMTVHPGVIHSLRDKVAVGMRMAFDARESSWGFSPLVNRALGNGPFFVEGVMPIRFQQNAAGANQTSIGLAAHDGIGF